jgi:hypothetical protein
VSPAPAKHPSPVLAFGSDHSLPQARGEGSGVRLPPPACDFRKPSISLRPDAAVAQLVEQRIRNSIAAVSSYCVLSPQVLNCLHNWLAGLVLFWFIPARVIELGSKMVATSSSFVLEPNGASEARMSARHC